MDLDHCFAFVILDMIYCVNACLDYMQMSKYFAISVSSITDPCTLI